jgi:D-alanyl-D-alanine-carboxypeptidase/D-alanyl-D-alanine-endopeptidase
LNRIAAILGLSVVAMSAPAAAQTVDGDWHGTLDAGGTKIPLAVHIQRGPDGTLTGTVDSPNQGANGLPIGEVSKDPGVLAFTVPVVGGSYAGRWDAESGRWKGQWRQGGAGLPLDLEAGPLPEAAVTPPPPLPENWTIPADDAIARLIDERDAARAGQGMVVGVIEPKGTRIVAEGPEGGPAFDGTSLFEIGSISKVFTALLLADMVNKGEVSLDDPAAKYLPAGHRMPERGGRQITLRNLSQHTSGLPRLPDNMPYGDPDDPYADYTEAQLLTFLDGYVLPRDIGAQSDYSNLGVGLLGYLLARAAHQDYETLLAERITGPLGMRDTAVSLSPAQQARLVQGHDIFMRPAKPWALPTLMGAGGIRSTANDMLKFAGAVIDPNSPIAQAVATAASNRFDTGNRAEQALGWQIMHPGPEREALFHNGGTGGYRSALLIEPKRETAVVVLVNSAVEPSATDFAVHLLIGAPLAPLQPIPTPPPPPVARTEIELPIAELDRVVGSYDFGNGILHITREGTVMRSAREGVPTLQMFPEAPLQFFFKAINAQYRFTTDDSGKVTGVTFTQPGVMEASGKRIDP